MSVTEQFPLYMGSIPRDSGDMVSIEGMDDLIEDAAVRMGSEVVKGMFKIYYGGNLRFERVAVAFDRPEVIAHDDHPTLAGV